MAVLLETRPVVAGKSKIRSVAVHPSIAASVLKGRRTDLLIVPETQANLALLGIVALLEPYEWDIDQDDGLSVCYQACGAPGAYRSAGSMPIQASRLTMVVHKIERVNDLAAIRYAMQDGVFSIRDQWAWNSDAEKPALYQDEATAWRKGAAEMWDRTNHTEKTWLALHGKIIRGNAILVSRSWGSGA